MILDTRPRASQHLTFEGGAARPPKIFVREEKKLRIYETCPYVR